MGFLMVILFCFCYVQFSPKFTSATDYNVTSYGAKGDGNTDDTKAFLRAWKDFCRDHSPDPTLIIPSGKTFYLGPVIFNGPCKSNSVTIKLLGNIIAPNTLQGWKGCAKNRFWLYFASIDGLIIDGPGQIDGRGDIWWGNRLAEKMCDSPTALHFSRCNDLRLSGTTHINSPNLHISIVNSNNVDIGYLHIFAPADSPNTDGIDLSLSKHVHIHDSNIQTGDDCVAINGATFDINVTRVLCGPGHGISIGSLGEHGGYDIVENVRVEKCNITGTQNGLRIKTVPGGRGHAKGIVYQDINLENVKNPIIIDQHYCANMENHYCPSPPSEAAVQVSDVSYLNIYGSSATKQAITFNCSGKFNCTGIYTDQVTISGDHEYSYCINTEGKFVSTTPSVKCN